MEGIVGQVLHGSARTTAAVRRAIQESQASLNRLAGQYGISPKTVTKWRKRTSRLLNSVCASKDIALNRASGNRESVNLLLYSGRHVRLCKTKQLLSRLASLMPQLRVARLSMTLRDEP